MPLLIEHNPPGANIQCGKILRPFLNLMIQLQSSCDVFGGIINIRNTLRGNVSWLAHNRICFINCSSAGGRVRTEVQPWIKKLCLQPGVSSAVTMRAERSWGWQRVPEPRMQYCRCLVHTVSHWGPKLWLHATDIRHSFECNWQSLRSKCKPFSVHLWPREIAVLSSHSRHAWAGQTQIISDYESMGKQCNCVDSCGLHERRHRFNSKANIRLIFGRFSALLYLRWIGIKDRYGRPTAPNASRNVSNRAQITQVSQKCG